MDQQIYTKKRKLILKCYHKCKNVVEVRRRFRREFHIDPHTRLKNKFESDGTFQDVKNSVLGGHGY